MVQVLNSLTGDYELQILLLEKRIGNKMNPLAIDEFKEELNLRFERLSSKKKSIKNDESGEEKALFTAQFKGKCCNCGKLGHKAAQCKFKQAIEENCEMICNYCKEPGHVKANCFKVLKKNQNQGEGNSNVIRNGVAGTVADIVLSSVENNEDFDHEIWIGDSGASCNYCNNDEGLYDCKTISEELTVGNGNVMIAKKMGKLKCGVLQKNGEKLIVTLENVKFVPELWVNLFSIGKALKKGFDIGNDGEIIKLTKGNVSLTFDKIMKTKNGFVPGIRLMPVLSDIGTAVVESGKGESIDVNNLHKILGHCGDESTRLTGKAFGFNVTGKFDTCEACSVAKARQKNVNKEWKGGSTTSGEQLYVDISSIKGNSFGGAKFWALVVDDYSTYCWSYLLKRKDELAGEIIGLIKELNMRKFVSCF
jgi:hypothetical protein